MFNVINVQLAQAFGVGCFVGFLFGIMVGGFAMMLAGWRYLQQDPDGPGGWRNRMQQLSTEHDARVHSTTAMRLE